MLDDSRAIAIARGSMRDYAALARFHYRADRPATVCAVWRAALRGPTMVGCYARRVREVQVLGVLVLSMPVLNCRARRHAWPGRFEGNDRPAIAARINDEVRTISRVIIDPRVRGIGLAAVLVGHALDHAPTRLTEAMAAMGDACGFFERAGMRRIDAPLAPDDARLRRKLRRIGVDPSRLLSSRSCAERLNAMAADDREALVRAAETWRLASGVRKRKTAHLSDEPARIVALAARQLVCRPVYYSHERAEREGAVV